MSGLRARTRLPASHWNNAPARRSSTAAQRTTPVCPGPQVEARRDVPDQETLKARLPTQHTGRKKPAPPLLEQPERWGAGRSRSHTPKPSHVEADCSLPFNAREPVLVWAAAPCRPPANRGPAVGSVLVGWRLGAGWHQPVDTPPSFPRSHVAHDVPGPLLARRLPPRWLVAPRLPRGLAYGRTNTVWWSGPKRAWGIGESSEDRIGAVLGPRPEGPEAAGALRGRVGSSEDRP